VIEPNDHEEVFVWLFGPSAVGKDTTVKAVMADPQHPLRAHLGLPEPICVVAASLDTSGSRSAAAILGEIESLRDRGQTHLLKGQQRDFDFDEGQSLPQALRHERPRARHEVVLLWTSVGDLAIRMHRKHVWMGEANARSELLSQIAQVPTWGLPICWVKAEGGALRIGETPDPEHPFI
jgi:hypothetical protein